MELSGIIVLAAVATAWGVVGSVASLLQARRVHLTGSSRDVSLGFLSFYAGGHLIWGTYGLAERNWPLIINGIVGTVCVGVTLAFVIRYREPKSAPSRQPGAPRDN